MRVLWPSIETGLNAAAAEAGAASAVETTEGCSVAAMMAEATSRFMLTILWTRLFMS
jgi:hypothetical protein